MTLHRRTVLKTLAAAGACASSWPAWAQANWPNRPIRYIVPFAPGGTTDILGRVVGEKLAAALGQPVIIENKPGQGGSAGAAELARAAPDGYTLGGGTISSHAINATLYDKLPYDPIRDFAPVASTGVSPYLLATHPALPVNNLKDFIAHARARPGVLNYSSSGAGGLGHLSGELFNQLTGVKMQHVPFKGGAQLITELVGNRVQLEILDPNFAKPHVDAGRLKAVVVTSKDRIVTMPNVPTTAESGLPTYTPTFWMGLYAPAGTPKAIVDQVNGELRTILSNPEVRKRYAARGFTTEWMTPEATQRRIAAELSSLNKIVDDAKIERQ